MLTWNAWLMTETTVLSIPIIFLLPFALRIYIILNNLNLKLLSLIIWTIFFISQISVNYTSFFSLDSLFTYL